MIRYFVVVVVVVVGQLGGRSTKRNVKRLLVGYVCSCGKAGTGGGKAQK